MRFNIRLVMQTCATLPLLAALGCHTDRVEVSGSEFLKAFENRKPNEEYVFRSGSKDLCCLDHYRMAATESVFKKVGTICTRSTNLTEAQVQMLKEKAVRGAWAEPFKTQ